MLRLATQLVGLNQTDRQMRLESLRELIAEMERGELNRPAPGGAVNNHIHTFYSFSPYSPTAAVWTAYRSGLETAGIMDHDTIAGAREFIEAGWLIGLATTIGMEVRVDMSGTPLKGRRINHPDQISSAYVALHGIPHTRIDRVAEFISPFQEKRNERNRRMVDRLNDLLQPKGFTIDFDRDVEPLSRAAEGGSITERHLLFAVARKMTVQYGRGSDLVDFLRDDLGLGISGRVGDYLADERNPHYEYDLLGALKSDLAPAFYIDADEEMPDVRVFIDLANEVGAIAAYAYLGDVGVSVTGDKKTQRFEDAYLDVLFDTIKDLGFHAVTYMPSRNSLKQLERVQDHCRRYKLFQISGEDINSPRQSFICEAMRAPQFANLIESTWALIGHERAATADPAAGMFTPDTIAQWPDLDERTRRFASIGKQFIADQPVSS